jgi:hypothetical protein
MLIWKTTIASIIHTLTLVIVGRSYERLKLRFWSEGHKENKDDHNKEVEFNWWQVGQY